MANEPATHHSYLVRLWQDHPGAPWRATLTSVARVDNPQHFSNLETLFSFLLAQVGATTWLRSDDQGESSDS
jgi:hypothetical protein